MENDNLQSIWKTIETPQKSNSELTTMFEERNHPVLKAIKKQALFELVGFTIFLFCYYSMFNGIQKPLFINMILIFAIAVNMFHHFRGFRLQQQFRANQNLKEDLKKFVTKLKSYQLETMLSKIVWIAGMIIFFTANIQFNEKKWWVAVAIAIVLMVQLVLLTRIWSKRIAKLKTIISDLESA